MQTDFIDYLFGDLFDHLERLKESAYDEDPNGENVEYHYEKAVQIATRLKEHSIKVDPPIRLVGGERRVNEN